MRSKMDLEFKHHVFCKTAPIHKSLKAENIRSALFFKKQQNFFGGPVVKNPPSSARDTGPILGLGMFHVAWSN